MRKDDRIKEERKHRMALTLLVSAFVFCIILITVLISFVLVYLLVAERSTPAILSQYVNARYSLIYMGVVSLIIGLSLTVIVSRITLTYINRAINQVNRLASGDFKARMELGGPFRKHPTFIEIADSFNRMAEELENTEMLRSDFINNFSHEFKTPIVSIAGFAKLLKRGNLTDAQRAEYLDIIEEESLRLSAMATNVLNMTRVENQTILTNTTTYNLSEQLRSCILLLESKWTKKGIEFDLDFPEYRITANEELLKHVWINLIDNAIKFSPERRLVSVTLKEGEQTLMVSVRNTGSEIPEEQQARIFHKFYQADESHASEGNGIGLALVKSVVELHRGSVVVESADNTTVFTVILPNIKEI